MSLLHDVTFKAAGAAALELQARDFFMLELLYAHPLLTARQLDALVIARFPTVPSPQGKLTWPTHPGGLQRRRAKMRSYDLIDIPHTSEERGLDLQYYLTQRGYRVLQNAREETLYWTKNSYAQTGFGTLLHFQLLNELVGCLSIALPQGSGELSHWCQDSRIYKAVSTPSYEDAERDDTRLTPDAFTILKRPDGSGQAAFIEADRSGGVRLQSNARPTRTMLARFRRYHHHQRATDNPFVVLILTTNTPRMENMQALIREHEPWMSQPTGLFWFKTLDFALEHPSPVLENWQTAWQEPRHLLTD